MEQRFRYHEGRFSTRFYQISPLKQFTTLFQSKKIDHESIWAGIYEYPVTLYFEDGTIQKIQGSFPPFQLKKISPENAEFLEILDPKKSNRISLPIHGIPCILLKDIADPGILNLEKEIEKYSLSKELVNYAQGIKKLYQILSYLNREEEKELITALCELDWGFHSLITDIFFCSRFLDLMRKQETYQFINQFDDEFLTEFIQERGSEWKDIVEKNVSRSRFSRLEKNTSSILSQNTSSAFEWEFRKFLLKNHAIWIQTTTDLSTKKFDCSDLNFQEKGIKVTRLNLADEIPFTKGGRIGNTIFLEVKNEIKEIYLFDKDIQREFRNVKKGDCISFTCYNDFVFYSLFSNNTIIEGTIEG